LGRANTRSFLSSKITIIGENSAEVSHSVTLGSWRTNTSITLQDVCRCKAAQRVLRTADADAPAAALPHARV
jgi:hypothetical protein